MHYYPTHLKLPFCDFVTVMKMVLYVLRPQIFQQFPNIDFYLFQMQQGKWAWWTISLPGRVRRAAKPILYPIFSLLVDSFSLMLEYALCFDHLHENSFHILNRLDPVFSFWWKDMGRESWQPDPLSDLTSCVQAPFQAAFSKSEPLPDSSWPAFLSCLLSGALLQRPWASRNFCDLS